MDEIGCKHSKVPMTIAITTRVARANNEGFTSGFIGLVLLKLRVAIGHRPLRVPP